MYYILTRMVSLMLAFGLFIGCSTLSSSEKQPSGNDSLSQEEIEEELKNLNDPLNATHSSNNPDTYYRKGYLLGELAQKERNPENRKSTYQEMQEVLQEAKQLSASSGSSSTHHKVDEYLKVKWSKEHNQGVQIIQSDSSTLRSNDYKRAAAYFTNAIVILPDSAISYNMKAQTLYRNHQVDDAIAVLESARPYIDPLPSSVLEQLAFLYLETGQNSKAVAAYEEAESFSDENLNIIHGLANAYINIDDHEKAVELLNLLVETEPENIIYAQTLGAELYFLGAQKVDQIITYSNSENTLTAAAYSEIDELFDEAENQLKKALSSDSGNAELKQKLTYFYNNSAAKYQQLLPYISAGYTENATNTIEQYLQSSIPLLESLTQNNPDKRPLWENLYRAYNYLGMDDKAEKIESKINR